MISIASAAARIRSTFPDAAAVPALEDRVHEAFSRLACTSGARTVCSQAPFARENVFALAIPHRVLDHAVAHYIGVRRWIPDGMLAAATSAWCPTPHRDFRARQPDHELTTAEVMVDVRCAALHSVLIGHHVAYVAVAATFAPGFVTVYTFMPLTPWPEYLRFFPNLRELRSDLDVLSHVAAKVRLPMATHRDLRFAYPARHLKKGHVVFFSTSSATVPMDREVLSLSDRLEAMRREKVSLIASPERACGLGSLDAFLCHTLPVPIAVDEVTVVRAGKGEQKVYVSGVDPAARVRRSMLVLGSEIVSLTLASAIAVQQSPS